MRRGWTDATDDDADGDAGGAHTWGADCTLVWAGAANRGPVERMEVWPAPRRLLRSISLKGALCDTADITQVRRPQPLLGASSCSVCVCA